MKYDYKHPTVQSLIHGFFKAAIDNSAQTVTIPIGEAKNLVEWFVGSKQELRELPNQWKSDPHKWVAVSSAVKQILGEEASS